MAKMHGIDLSGSNPSSWIDSMEPDFVMIKATEGVGYTSDSLKEHLKAWAFHCQQHKKPMLTGFYHYARPDSGNTAIAEAKDFLAACTDALKGYPQAIPLYVLDWEGKSVGHPTTWAEQFLIHVKGKTLSTPLIYMSASIVRRYDWSEIAKEARLWVAAYTDGSTPQIKWWENYSMWQYTDEPVDQDWFMAGESAWYTLAGKKKAVPQKTWRITEQSENRIVLER